MAARALPRLVGLLLGLSLGLGAWSAADARIHALSGDARLQVGNGFPMPIGFTPAPTGRIQAISGATIRPHGTHAASNPARVVIEPEQLTHPGTTMVLAVQGFGTAVAQVLTAIPIQFPQSKILFAPGGRTGAPTVTFCPGQAVTMSGNPMCASGSAGVIPGRLTYTRTSHQFGGAAFFAAQGIAQVGIPAATPAPCAFATNPACLAIFWNADPAPMPAQGAPFGFRHTRAGTAPSPGLFGATITSLGRIIGITPTGMGPGIANPVTSYGGPWTTGMLKVEQPAAFGAMETFTLTGSDARLYTLGSTALPSSKTPNGTGALSLVAGAVSDSSLSGPNANRGWLNLVVGPRLSHVPLLPDSAVGALLALTALSGAYALKRQSLRRSPR